MEGLSAGTQRPGSVTVLGILNIVLGSFWLLGGTCAAAAMPMSLLMGQGEMPQHPFGPPFMAVSAGQSCVDAIVGLFLLLGGIGLLQGKPWGRKFSIAAAISKLGTFAIMQGVSIVMGMSVLRGGPIPAMEQFDVPKELMGAVMVLGPLFGCCVMVFHLAYPVTLIVFMYSKGVRMYFAGMSDRPVPMGGVEPHSEEKEL